jgi:hypothetical protein
MNDYYPFLLNETAKLDNVSGEKLRELYGRIQNDLVTNLRRPALRLPEAEIDAERRAFGAAVQRIEAELNIQYSKAGTADSTTARMSSNLAKIIPLTPDESNCLRNVKTEADAAQGTNTGEPNFVLRVETDGIGSDLNERKARMLRAIGTPKALERATHQLAEKPEKQIIPPTDKPRPLRKYLVLVLVLTVAACLLIGRIIYFISEIKTSLGFD